MPWITNQPIMNLRASFAIKAQDTQNFSELCHEYGISRKTGYKWLAIYSKEGVARMQDASRRPKASPNALSEEQVCRIVRLRQAHPAWGARKLQEIYRRSYGEPPSESSFKRVLERCALVTKRPKRRISNTGAILNTGRKALAPNDIWTIDFKGWWYDAEGKSNPLTVRDEFSRYILELRHVDNGTTDAVKRALEQVFERCGLPKAIRSDNGSPFACTRSLKGISQLSAWWLALGIELERSRPGCPQDNGAHERMHADLMREIESIAKRRLKADQADVKHGARKAGFDLWRKEFNEERPHEALEMKMPSEIYRKSERRYQRGEFDLDYEGMETRKVQATGSIRMKGVSYFLTRSLSGWEVGLSYEKGGYAVYFCKLRLGTLEPETASILPTAAPEKPNPKAGQVA